MLDTLIRQHFFLPIFGYFFINSFTLKNITRSQLRRIKESMYFLGALCIAAPQSGWFQHRTSHLVGFLFLYTYLLAYYQGFGSGSAWIRINLGCWIRIHEREKWPTVTEKSPTITEKSKEISRSEVLDVRAEGFSCSLCVLYGGQGISKLQFLKKKI